MASRTFAYRKLAHRLSWSLSVFPNFFREYFDPVIKADQCAQYDEDFGIAANNPQQLIEHLRRVFQCLRNAGIELKMAKFCFRVQEKDVLGRKISTQGVAPQKQKVAKTSEKSTFRNPKKTQRYIGFLIYYRNKKCSLAKRVTPFFQVPKATDAKGRILITSKILKESRKIVEAVDRCCQQALRKPLPVEELVLIIDTNLKAAGYAVLIEEDQFQRNISKPL